MKPLRLAFWILFAVGAGWFFKTRYLDRLDQVESEASLAGGPTGWASTPGIPAPGGKPVRVLFIGNSLTFTENMPAMVVEMARNAGINMEAAQHTPGGFKLNQHAAAPQVLDMLSAGRWDIVVLQEQSQVPSFRDEFVRPEMDQAAATLATRARAASPGVKIFLYSHFAHRNGDARNAAVDPEVGTFDGMQRRINGTYRRVARDLNATVIPVGAAWTRVRKQRPDIELYRDDSHPNRVGAYLIACVFYVTLFEETPVGVKFTAGIDPATAAVVQQAALDAYKVEP